MILGHKIDSILVHILLNLRIYIKYTLYSSNPSSLTQKIEGLKILYEKAESGLSKGTKTECPRPCPFLDELCHKMNHKPKKRWSSIVYYVDAGS